MIYSKDSNVTLFVASQEENPELINSLNLSLDNNEKKEISIEDMSIENFDLMALEGLLLANKKLRYLQSETDMRKVSMGEIKIYNDIVANVKNQIHGKAPDTIINIANQNNLAQQIDYSNMSQDELMKELAKIDAKEKMQGMI